MIQKYTFGKPFNTYSVIAAFDSSKGKIPFGKLSNTKEFEWKYSLKDEDIIYGLGQTMKGINLRGSKFRSWCLDNPNQDEGSESLYGAHNFLIIFGKTTFGIFFDYPGEIFYDIGFSEKDYLTVKAEHKSLNIYVITSDSKTNTLKEIVRNLRQITGQSYIPPKWAFGFNQSRWGYKNKKDIDLVIANYKKHKFPLDSLCLDIDYMEDYKDFTVDSKKFPAFEKYNRKLLKHGIRLVPIIDAGIKKLEGYDVYENGKPFFCNDKDGKPFVAGVWPGDSCFIDFLNPEGRDFFGKHYKRLTDAGIEGFWNDMNEPATFYSKQGLNKAFEKLDECKNKALDINGFFEFTAIPGSVCNSKDDTKLFFHKVSKEDAGDFAETKTSKNGSVLVKHEKVHNLFGYNMTRSASENFSKTHPYKRILMYSRSSFIGAHRYGGIWTGDNHSFWSNILLSLHMMASLNMTGFLYTGSDIGGFNGEPSRDLMMRWLSFALFTPLCRNHSAKNKRRQEFYQFENVKEFKSMMDLRYSLIPYFYSEFVKASINNGMYFRPLSFDYQNDKHACNIEDQIMLGDAIMVCPVYTQNASGRYVYLPENMLMVEWKNSKIVQQKSLTKGDHYISVPLESVVFFIKDNHIVPFAKPSLNTSLIDTKKLSLIGNAPAGTEYFLYEDDGFTTDISLEKYSRILKK